MNELIIILLPLTVLGGVGCLIADFRKACENRKQAKGKR